jgi:hypothetical protein
LVEETDGIVQQIVPMFQPAEGVVIGGDSLIGGVLT